MASRQCGANQVAATHAPTLWRKSKRLQWDASNKEPAASFMAIKREMTASGRSVTYAAGRSKDTGHSDLAWACMNALSNEALEVGTGLATPQTQSFIEVYP